jgi:hypothetical protein
MESKLDLVRIHTVQGELSAYVIKSHLESEGIPAILIFETYFNLKIGVFASFGIAVPQRFADDAKLVIGITNPDLLKRRPSKKLWSFIILMLTSMLISPD